MSIYKIVGLLHKHFLGCAVSVLLDNEALLRAVHLLAGEVVASHNFIGLGTVGDVADASSGIQIEFVGVDIVAVLVQQDSYDSYLVLIDERGELRRCRQRQGIRSSAYLTGSKASDGCSLILIISIRACQSHIVECPVEGRGAMSAAGAELGNQRIIANIGS